MPPKSPVHEGDEDVTTSFGEFSENVDHDSVDAYDDCSHHSDDDAILAQCIESALPKVFIINLPPLYFILWKSENHLFCLKIILEFYKIYKNHV